MSAIADATAALREAESRLRCLVSNAAKEGDYASVVQIAAWAQTLCDMLSKKPSAHDNGVDFAYSNGNGVTLTQVKTRRSSQKKQHTDYPRFFRRGAELVRIAWSRRARSEYQHRTSENVLKTVAETVARIGKEGKIFSTDEVLPVRDSDGSEVPAYQAYVCITLFKLTGLIEQHGRQGYSLTHPDDFTAAVDVVWRKLPSK